MLEEDSPRAPQTIFDSGVPILGICYGEQVIAAQLGGKVAAGDNREFGRAEVEILSDSPFFEGVWQKGRRYPVWMSHGDAVTELPQGFRRLATSEHAPISVIADEARRIYATQFHLEVVHTPDGARLLANFVHQGRGAEERLDNARLPRRGGGLDPRRSRAGPRALRALGRRRFGGRGAVDP